MESTLSNVKKMLILQVIVAQKPQTWSAVGYNCQVYLIVPTPYSEVGHKNGVDTRQWICVDIDCATAYYSNRAFKKSTYPQVNK